MVINSIVIIILTNHNHSKKKKKKKIQRAQLLSDESGDGNSDAKENSVGGASGARVEGQTFHGCSLLWGPQRLV